MTGKKINNPFIKQSRSKKFKKKCFLCIFFVFLFLILAIYSIFFTNLFEIKSIKVSDLKKVEKSELEEIIKAQIESRSSFFPQKNILFFSEANLLNQLSDYNFLEVDVKKSLISGLKITITERETRYILEEGDYFYYLDESANIVKEQKICQNIEQDYANTSSNTDELLLTEENNKNCISLKDEILKDNYYPVIENINKNNSRVDLDKKRAKINQEYLNFANKIFNYFGIESDFRVKKFIIDETRETLKVKLYNNILVFFNLKDDQDGQIKRFILLRNEYRDRLKNVEYIDIRYGDKIYYR